jgi:hypothetical protein
MLRGESCALITLNGSFETTNLLITPSRHAKIVASVKSGVAERAESGQPGGDRRVDLGNVGLHGCVIPWWRNR